MGQAKNRGTFEERKSKAIALRIQREEEKQRKEQEAEALLSPEERKARKDKRHKRNMAMATVLGMAASTLR